MFYLEAENQLAVVNTVRFDLIFANMPREITTFKDLPDTVLLLVRKDTGEIVTVPVWREVKQMRSNVDANILMDNVMAQIAEALKSEKMVEAYGELMFANEEAKELIRGQLTMLYEYGISVLCSSRRSIMEERQAYNSIGKVQVMECVRENGWKAVRNGDEVVYGPKLMLKSKNTVIDFNQNFGSRELQTLGDGTAKLFGVPVNIVLHNPFVRLGGVIKDPQVVVNEIKRLFAMHFPFLNTADTLTDIKIELGEIVSTNIFRTPQSIKTKLQLMQKVAAEKK